MRQSPLDLTKMRAPKQTFDPWRDTVQTPTLLSTAHQEHKIFFSSSLTLRSFFGAASRERVVITAVLQPIT